MRITMSGLPYAGKGELREPLAKVFGLQQFSVGDLRRLYAKGLGLTIEQLNTESEKDPIWDVKADEYQKDWAQENSNFLLEGRLSYHFIPDSIKLFLSVSDKVAAKRAQQAQRDSEHTYKTLRDRGMANRQRCTSDCIRYFNLYGIQNCYDEQHFDIIVNTDGLSKKEVLEETVRQIQEF
ncbi:hypothetical protein HN747_01855 [archaeon]|nr:hypothetical protein [archaeon]